MSHVHVLGRHALRLLVGALLAAMGVVAAVGGSVSTASACTCGGESASSLMRNTDGGVIGVAEVNDSGYRFEVSEWLSQDDGEVVVSIEPGVLCGLQIETGVPVAVFFNINESGTRTSNLCWSFPAQEALFALSLPVADPDAGRPSLVVSTLSSVHHLWVLDDRERLVASTAPPAAADRGYLAEVELCPGDQRIVEAWVAVESAEIVVREMSTMQIVSSHTIDADTMQDGRLNLLVCRDAAAQDLHVGIKPGGTGTWLLHQVGGAQSSSAVSIGTDRLFDAHFSPELDQVVLVTSGGLRFVGINNDQVAFVEVGGLSRLYLPYVTSSVSPDSKVLAISVWGMEDSPPDMASRLLLVDVVSEESEVVAIPAVEHPQHIWIDDDQVVVRSRIAQPGVAVDTTTLQVRAEPDAFAMNRTSSFPDHVTGAQIQSLGEDGALRRVDIKTGAVVVEREPQIPSLGARLIPLAPSSPLSDGPSRRRGSTGQWHY